MGSLGWFVIGVTGCFCIPLTDQNWSLFTQQRQKMWRRRLIQIQTMYFLLLFILLQELQKRKKPPLYTSSSTITMAKSTPISTLTTNTLPSRTTIVSFSSITITSTVNIAATSSTLLLSREHVTVHTTTTEPNDSSVKAVNTLQVEQVVSTAKSEVGSLGISGTLFVWFLFLQGINTSLP